MPIYADSEATKVIPLVSDDGGVTWYPKSGDASTARPLEGEPNVIRLVSDNTIDWHHP